MAAQNLDGLRRRRRQLASFFAKSVRAIAIAIGLAYGVTVTSQETILMESVAKNIQARVAKAVIERLMYAHLDYKHGEDKPEGQLNERNGASPKTVLTEKGFAQKS
jgi:transposase-like protein